MPERLHAGGLEVGLEVQESQITESTPLLCTASTSQRRRIDTTALPVAPQPLARGKERQPQQCQETANDHSRASSSNFEKDVDSARSIHQASSSSLRSPSTSSTAVDDRNAIPSTCSENGDTGQLNYVVQRWRLLPEGVSLRLENSGSVARDHLASERTFLAYMRTSLAIASSGVALVQLFSAASHSTAAGSAHRLHRYIQPLGASAVVVGLVILFVGVSRYFTVQSALTKGYFPVARLTTGFIAVMLTALVALTFAVLMAGKLVPKGI